MLERERKLAVFEDFQLPRVLDVAGLRPVPLHAQDLRTTYLDTTDLRLLRWGCSLRWREGEGWTLKRSVGEAQNAFVRDERRLPGEDGKLPPEAADLVQAFTRGAALRSVIRLRTTREGVELFTRDDVLAATVVHDRVTVLVAGKVMGRFAEVEIERGDTRGTNGVPLIVRALERAGATGEVDATKLERALSVIGRGPSPPAIDEVERYGDSLVTTLTSSVGRLIRSDPDVRIGEDPEAVHRARVAVRRLRSDLRSFTPRLDPAPTKQVRRELGWLGDALGDVRDIDVLLEQVEHERADAPSWLDDGIGHVVTHLQGERAKARDVLLGDLRSRRYRRMLDALEEFAASPPLRPDAADLGARDVMQPGWRRLRRAVAHAGAAPTDEQLHRIRILAKRVRYSAEALAPSLGKPAARFARDAARLQDVLGAHQDAIVAMSRLAGVAKVSESDTAYAAGWLAGRRDIARDRARSDWRPSWKALDRRKRRFW